MCSQSLWILLAACFLSVGAVSQTKNTVHRLRETKTTPLPDAIADFTLDLTKQLYRDSGARGNVLFSPLSIYGALALVHLGASGKTRTEIADVMKVSNYKRYQIHEGFGKILLDIGNKYARPISDISIANGIFVQKEFKIKSNYLDKLKSYYNVLVTNLDFTDGNVATDTINQWVANSTKGQIPQLFSQTLDQFTKMVLASSLYFNAKWTDHFIRELTQVEKFNTGTNEVDVHMMNKKSVVPYYNNAALEFEAITLYFEGYDYSMTFILPNSSDKLQNLVNSLTVESLQQITNQSIPTGVDYKIPRLKFGTSKSLNGPLSSMGLKKLFEKADLFEMVDSNELKVSEVQHGADIELDEDGAKATAITTIQLTPLSASYVPKNAVKFYLDRPFMLLINHRPTSAILFSAVVHQPEH